MSSKKICFVISPIGDEGSDIRKRSDQVLKYVISPPASNCGYSTLRADTLSEPGQITTQIIQQILDAPMVVADLTGTNPNVFYELAIRHAIRKPLVQIIQKGDKIPFDVATMRTIPVDHHDLDSVEEAKVEIEKQIRNVESKKPDQIESPISATVDLQTLKRSDNPEDRTLGNILTALTQLRSDMNQLKSFVSPTQLPNLEAEMRIKELHSRIAQAERLKSELLEHMKKTTDLGGAENADLKLMHTKLYELESHLDGLRLEQNNIRSLRAREIDALRRNV